MICTDVIFRKHKATGEIVAFLLDVPTEITGECCKTYRNSKGFYSERYPSITRSTTTCKEEDYKDVLDYLIGMGFRLSVTKSHSHERYKKSRLENLQKELSS